jgi:hypothetical protein
MRGDRGGFGGGGYRGRPEGNRFGGGGYGERPPRSEAECFNCHGLGHFAKDCTKRTFISHSARDMSGRRGGDRDRPRYDRDERDNRDNRDRGDRDNRDNRDSRGDRDRDRRRRSRSRSSRSSRSSSGGDRRRNSNREY